MLVNRNAINIIRHRANACRETVKPHQIQHLYTWASNLLKRTVVDVFPALLPYLECVTGVNDVLEDQSLGGCRWAGRSTIAGDKGVVDPTHRAVASANLHKGANHNANHVVQKRVTGHVHRDKVFSALIDGMYVQAVDTAVS